MTEQFLQEINNPKHESEKNDDPTDDVTKGDLSGWINSSPKKEEEDAELPRKEWLYMVFRGCRRS